VALFFNRHNIEIPEDKKIQDIKLTEIKPNRYQPRNSFSDESIAELAQTLDQEGLLQPIIVRPVADNYEIIAGERRFRAAKSLEWETIPAVVKDLDDDQAASLAVIENLQREDLNPIDEARAYQRLMDLNDLTQTQLAQEVGKSQSYIANKLRLLRLTPKVQSYLVSGQISSRHGRALLNLNAKDQERVLAEILAKNLNVKETEQITADVEGYFKKNKKPAKKTRAIARTATDLKVQINTIKKAVKLAKESGIKVKVKEKQSPDDYTITIELKKK
jgi:ParB family chromosome partitioning protein